MENLPDYKALKRLAEACRKAGIKTFKGFGMEFTLADEAPVSTYKTKKAAPVQADKPFESDSLTPEQLLHWSVLDMPTEPTEAAE